MDTFFDSLSKTPRFAWGFALRPSWAMARLRTAPAILLVPDTARRAAPPFQPGKRKTPA